MAKQGYRCKKCGGRMRWGQALQEIWGPGLPDFIGDKPGSGVHTICPTGRSRLISVMKCVRCGHSFIPPEE